MILAAITTALVVGLAAPDTAVAFGVVSRDLTGDGIPEVLTLTGTGASLDSLDVGFTIESAGSTLYSRAWRLTRAGFDPRRRLTDAEYRSRLDEYGSWFFEDSRFMSPVRFLAWLRDSSPSHIDRIAEVIARDMTPSDTGRANQVWTAMQAAGVTLFQFSPGGDKVQVIGWSATDGTFYDLLSCC